MSVSRTNNLSGISNCAAGAYGQSSSDYDSGVTGTRTRCPSISGSNQNANSSSSSNLFQRINTMLDYNNSLDLNYLTSGLSPITQQQQTHCQRSGASAYDNSGRMNNLNEMFTGGNSFAHNMAMMGDSGSSVNMQQMARDYNSNTANYMNRCQSVPSSAPIPMMSAPSVSKLFQSTNLSTTPPSYRAIRGIRYQDSPTFDQAMMMTGEGIGTSTGGYQPHTTVGGRDLRSYSPTESDSSGISSADSGLAELMTSLNMGSSVSPVLNRNATASPSFGSTGNQTLNAMMNSLYNSDNAAYQQMQSFSPVDMPSPSHLMSDRRWSNNTGAADTGVGDGSTIDRVARMHRNAASLYDANCTWSGQLTMKMHKNPVYSCKVFLGGVPWDITEAALLGAFKPFGPVKIEWPGKDNSLNPPKGYVYILFDHEKQVKSLLQACTYDFSSGRNWYYKISSKRMRCKEVQVIPWIVADSNYVLCPSHRLDPKKTVFVGALHGMLTAEGLATIMNDLFGGVAYAGLDTDKNKYPVGSGRVTFNSHKSYMKAVSSAFLEIKTLKFTKKVQIDPYLEDSVCSMCNLQGGPYFCRDINCFKYYCGSCWSWRHSLDTLANHRPMMRITRAAQQQQQQQQQMQQQNRMYFPFSSQAL